MYTCLSASGKTKDGGFTSWGWFTKLHFAMENDTTKLYSARMSCNDCWRDDEYVALHRDICMLYVYCSFGAADDDGAKMHLNLISDSAIADCIVQKHASTHPAAPFRLHDKVKTLMVRVVRVDKGVFILSNSLTHAALEFLFGISVKELNGCAVKLFVV